MTAGLILSIVSGGLSAFSATLMRLLSQAGGPHEGRTPPAMLFSFLMVTYFFFFGGVHVVCRLLGLTELPGWRWGALVWPSDRLDYALVGVNSVCTLAAWLATAAGYQDTRAAMVAFLQLTEMPWVYLLDIFLLGEPTTALATLGCGVVFAGALTVALQPKE